MATTEAFTTADFVTLKSYVRLSTVDRLKTIIAAFVAECHANMSKSGKKNELIQRIYETLDTWQTQGNTVLLRKAQGIIGTVRATGKATRHRLLPRSITVGSNHSYSGYRPGPYVPPNAPAQSRPMGYGHPMGAPAALPPPPAHGFNASPANPPRSTYRPKSSPFFTNEQSVSPVIECPESTGSQDRRSQSVGFTLNEDHIAKLRSTTETWQLRLFCTSSSFFGLGASAYRFSNTQCPIEFPPTCEIRVNNTQLSASTKGLKKKPGTAPPPNLGKAVLLNAGVANRVELIYVNSQQNSNQTPTPPKKYFMTVMLVQYTDTDRLVERLKKDKYRSSELIRQQRQAQRPLEEDDDIVAGPFRISLKCPLSYVRIATPTRSQLCVHPSCFDAMSWFSINEQTTTWSCPICEKPINQEDLIVDGYFDEILKATHEDTEDVMVEADGEWHTADNEYASSAWKLSHPSNPVAPPTPAPSSGPIGGSSHSPVPFGTVATSGSGKEKYSVPPEVEVYVLDSDEEDDRQVKRQLLRPGRPSSSVRGSFPPDSQASTVIDLTLSDDEDEAPPVTRKRAAVDEEPVFNAKRSRFDDPAGKVVALHHSAIGSDRGASPYVNGGTLSFAQQSPHKRPQDLGPLLPPFSMPSQPPPPYLPPRPPSSSLAPSPLRTQSSPYVYLPDSGPRASSSSVSPFGGGPLPPPFPGMQMPPFPERRPARFGQPPEWH